MKNYKTRQTNFIDRFQPKVASKVDVKLSLRPFYLTFILLFSDKLTRKGKGWTNLSVPNEVVNTGLPFCRYLNYFSLDAKTCTKMVGFVFKLKLSSVTKQRKKTHAQKSANQIYFG